MNRTTLGLFGADLRTVMTRDHTTLKSNGLIEIIESDTHREPII